MTTSAISALCSLVGISLSITQIVLTVQLLSSEHPEDGVVTVCILLAASCAMLWASIRLRAGRR